MLEWARLLELLEYPCALTQRAAEAVDAEAVDAEAVDAGMGLNGLDCLNIIMNTAFPQYACEGCLVAALEHAFVRAPLHASAASLHSTEKIGSGPATFLQALPKSTC